MSRLSAGYINFLHLYLYILNVDITMRYKPNIVKLQNTRQPRYAQNKIKLIMVVEHLQKSSPLIFDEIRRWRYLLWDDYIDYTFRREQSQEIVVR